MTKYQIFFGECTEDNEFSKIEKILYIDNTGNKKIESLENELANLYSRTNARDAVVDRIKSLISEYDDIKNNQQLA